MSSRTPDGNALESEVSGVERSRILDAARAVRPVGASLLRRGPRLGGLDTLARQWAELDRLVADLRDGEWNAITSFGCPVRDLIAHIAGMLHHTAFVELGVPNPGPATTARDHWGLSRPLIELLRDLPVSATADELRRAAHALLAAARSAPVDAWAEHRRGVTRTDRIVSRAFELWIHADDVRAATGRALLDPDGARLDVMCDLSARFIAAGIAKEGIHTRDAVARLVLVGDGGGTWTIVLGDGAPLGARDIDVTVVAAAASFCRMAGRLVAPDALDIVVEGDATLVAPILAGARAFAE